MIPNGAALVQARQAIQILIDTNPESIIIYRKRLKDNGFGKLVEDPFDTAPVPTTMRVRISKEARGPETFSPVSSGLKTSESMYILTNYQTLIYINDNFEARDRWWEIGPVSQIKMHGGVIAYEAPLIESTPIPGDT